MEGNSGSVNNTKWSGTFSRLLRAMKIPDQLGRRTYCSGGTTSVGGGTTSVGGGTTPVRGGTTPANVNRSVMRKSPGVVDGSTGFHLG